MDSTPRNRLRTYTVTAKDPNGLVVFRFQTLATSSAEACTMAERHAARTGRDCAAFAGQTRLSPTKLVRSGVVRPITDDSV